MQIINVLKTRGDRRNDDRGDDRLMYSPHNDHFAISHVIYLHQSTYFTQNV